MNEGFLSKAGDSVYSLKIIIMEITYPISLFVKVIKLDLMGGVYFAMNIDYGRFGGFTSVW